MCYDVILKALQSCITKFGVQTYLNTNWSSWSADFLGQGFMIVNIYALTEYEIIKLIYNEKTCRLDEEFEEKMSLGWGQWQ